MEKFDAYFHPIDKIVALVEPDGRKPTDYMVLSEIIHSKLEDIVGSHDYHVLFHHVLKDLLEEYGITDLHYYQIVDSDSFPSYRDEELEGFLQMISELERSDYMINTWIDLDLIVKEAYELIDWAFVQRTDTQEILGRLQAAFNALVLRLPKACPYVMEGTFDTVVDNTDYTMVVGSGDNVALLDREMDLHLDLEADPEKYEEYTPWHTLSGIPLKGIKPIAMEFVVHEGDKFTIELGGQYGTNSEIFKITVDEDLRATANLDVIGGVNSITYPYRFGIWIDPISKEVGFTAEEGTSVSQVPFLTNSSIDVVGLRIKHEGLGQGKLFWYKNADDFELLYPKHSIGLCTGVAPNNATDKSRLYTAIERGRQIHPDGFTELSFTFLENAINAGQLVFDDYYATQAEIDSAENDIYIAIVSLATEVWEPPVVVADKSALQAAIGSTSSLVQGTYTTCSWDAYLPHLTEAGIVNDDSGADQNQVDKATRNLLDAIDNLEALVDRSDVIDLLATIDGLNKMEYTPKSWINMNNYAELARTLIANPCFVYFLDIYTDLLEAYNNLVEKGIMWDHGLPWDNLLGWRDE